MPELAEVEFYRKQWDAGIGQTVRAVCLHEKARVLRNASIPELLNLKGAKLIQSEAKAKQMLFTFSNSRYLSIHLGMSGKLMTATTAIVPDKHEHFVLKMESVALVCSDYRMFGNVYLSHEPPAEWVNIPPALLSNQFAEETLRNILERHQKTPLKSLLLNQAYFPGIGNWMADEILWRAHIHPLQRSQGLPAELTRVLFEKIKEVCRDAMEVIASDWNTPPDSWLFNHRWRKNGICPITRTPLQYIQISGRTACFSSKLQKLI